MQIARLLEIVFLLINHKKMTAHELAQRFEVSVRTIYRDVETLSAAGLPIYMSRGKNGGVSLWDHFTLSKTLLSDAEQDELLSALTSLQATSIGSAGTLTKLSALFRKQQDKWIAVDFADWSGKDHLFQALKDAILQRKVISFRYFNSARETTNRFVEPMQLWYKEKAWYLKAFCLTKHEPRLFKLSRMQDLAVSETTFAPRIIQDLPLPVQTTRCPVTLTLLIHPAMAFRVLDEFAPQDVQVQEDGYYLVTVTYPEDEWVRQYILSYGQYAAVLAPDYIRSDIRQRLEAALKQYDSSQTFL